MSDETVASQATQGGPDVEVQDSIPSGGAEPGPQEQAGAVADGQEDPQPSQSQDARGPANAAASQEQTSEDSSQSAPEEATAVTQSTAAPNSGATVAPAGATVVAQNGTAANGAAVAPSAAVAPEASHFTPRQAGAARKFGLAEEDLVVLEALGTSGRGLLDRLVKAESELGRRFSRLGRAEQARDAAGAPEQGTAANSAGDPKRDSSRLGIPAVAPLPAAPLAAAPQATAPQATAPQATVPQAAQGRPDAPQPSAEAAGLDREVERLRAQVADLQREAQEAEARRQELLRQVRLRSEGLLGRPSMRGRGGGELESPADRTARALEEWQSRKGIQFFQQ